MVNIFILLLPSVILITFGSATDQEPVGNKNIFFVETKSPSSRIGVFHHRQACSVESASRANPDWNIFIYVFNVDSFEENPFYEILLQLPNVFIKKVETAEFVKGTPAENLIQEGLKTKPEWLISHTSDVMRYVALARNPGVYMDLDIICMRPLDTLVPSLNFAGMEPTGPKIYTGSAIIGFGADKTGRKIAGWLVEDVSVNFTGSSWGANGLGTLTRGITKLCQTEIYEKATLEQCEGFKVYPPETFFAITYGNNDVFFRPEMYDIGKKLLNNSVVTHLWNYLTWNKAVEVGSKTLLAELGETYCPQVYDSVEYLF